MSKLHYIHHVPGMCMLLPEYVCVQIEFRILCTCIHCALCNNRYCMLLVMHTEHSGMSYSITLLLCLCTSIRPVTMYGKVCDNSIKYILRII